MRKIERPPQVKEKYATRTLIEDMVKIAKLNECREINDAEYPYWEKWKYLSKEWKLDPQRLWAVVKMLRNSSRYIDFRNWTHHYPLQINTPSVVQQLLHELDLGLGGSLHTNELIPAEQKNQYLVSSLMEEAIASSQLEGAATTRKLAKEMLESKRKPLNHSEQMIVNNYEAIQWIVKNKNVTITPEIILQIHHIITHNTLSDRKEEGAFRNEDDIHIVDVQTGAVVHTPPSHKQINKLIKEFCVFANDERREDFFLHPISKAIIIHFLIGYIHPFTDGNGRTARALFYWYLIKKRYWLIEYMSVSRVILGSKAQYTRAYQHTELDENDLTYFVLYNLKAISRSLDELKKYIERKNREKKEMLGLLRNTDYNDRQIAVLQEILNGSKNIFTVNEIENRFEVSNQTARNDLNELVKKGILQPRKSGKKIQFLITKEATRKIK